MSAEWAAILVVALSAAGNGAWRLCVALSARRKRRRGPVFIGWIP